MGIGTPEGPLATAWEWNHGACDVMAVALHRAYGFPLMAEFEWGYDDNGIEQLGFLVHAWVRLPDGRMLDAAGIQPMFEPVDGKDENDPWVQGYRIVEVADNDPHLLDIREEDDYCESIRISEAYSWIAEHLRGTLLDLGYEPANNLDEPVHAPVP